MKLSLRRRLLTVTALAAVACAGALFAVVPLARSSQDQRLERARDLAEREVERAKSRIARRSAADAGPAAAAPGGAAGGDAASPGDERSRWSRERGAAWAARETDGWARRTADPWRARRVVWSGTIDPRLGVQSVARTPPSAELRAHVARAAAGARGDATTVSDVELDEGDVALAIGRAPGGPVLWAAVLVAESPVAAAWRAGVLVLAAATLLLVLVSLHALVAIGRGTSSLARALTELSTDLSAPVSRPAVHELARIGDGIADMASRLRAARDEEARLSDALARQERLASLGRVAAGVAHEVRNPLAAIKLRVDLLRLSASSPAVAEDLGDVASEVARLDRLVADLLVVTGRRMGPRVPTDLAALVADRVELLRPWAEEHAVALHVSGEARADVDADAIMRVVDNLLRNAVEASPSSAEVRVELSLHDDRACLAVLDRGEGIAEERVAQLFEPFFTTKPEGTGLGLALSRAIAVAHGGELVYRREAGVTRFELRLPAGAVG